MSVLEKCPSYREYSYSKMTEKWQGPTPGVRLRECLSCREYSYSKMTEKRQGPTSGVCLIESIVIVK